ncbi:MAG: hypothetical protein WCX84_08680 [Syntrophales bacterium]|jgi:hypothetical protein|nr:hypothetical protein [Syntrophales bacterium]
MKKITVLFTCIFLLGACAADRTAVTKEPVTETNNLDRATTPLPPAEDLLIEAATALTQPNGTETGNGLKARALLARLTQSYPDSKWLNTAEALILLMDLQQACEEKMKGSLRLCEGLLSQKTKCEESENQCRQETIRLLQENEQLKKDLQNLKNLEIELEKRNRGLR